MNSYAVYPAAVIAIICVIVAISVDGKSRSLEAQLKVANQRASDADARAAQFELSGLQARVDLNTCQKQWQTSVDNGARAVEQAKIGAAKAERSATAWRKKYDAVRAECPLALAALDTACAGLEDY